MKARREHFSAHNDAGPILLSFGTSKVRVGRIGVNFCECLGRRQLGHLRRSRTLFRYERFKLCKRVFGIINTDSSTAADLKRRDQQQLLHDLMSAPDDLVLTKVSGERTVRGKIGVCFARRFSRKLSILVLSQLHLARVFDDVLGDAEHAVRLHIF